MTDKQPEALSALRDRLRSFEADHTPDGWPAVRMRDITALLDDLDNARSDNHVLRLGYAAARLEIESLKARPAEEPQPSPAAQGDALSDDAVRVPLDSLHADAAYLIGRLREGSMPYARVIEIIRERIDAAKAAIRARAEQGDALDAARYRWLREGNDAKHGAAWHVAVNLYGCEWDAAIDAARKQGANHD
jgi:hypothetical protein